MVHLKEWDSMCVFRTRHLFIAATYLPPGIDADEKYCSLHVKALKSVTKYTSKVKYYTFTQEKRVNTCTYQKVVVSLQQENKTTTFRTGGNG